MSGGLSHSSASPNWIVLFGEGCSAAEHVLAYSRSRDYTQGLQL